MHLCKKHFVEDVERKIKLTIRQEYSIQKNDIIAVALSGGKDSSVALYMMHKILGKRPDIEIVAVSVDEGIEGYRPNSLEVAKNLTETLGDPTHNKVFQRSTWGNYGRSGSIGPGKRYMQLLRRP